MKSATSLLSLLVLLSGCAARDPLPVVSQVDLPRFMGTWYVIACIPTRLERRAYGETEAYRLDPDGRVLTQLAFHMGALDGPLKEHKAVGYVRADSHGAIWGMQFVWPLRADYRITYLDSDYTHTIVGREKRDYVWIMARTPQIADADYSRLAALVAAQGYDPTRLRRMPQTTS